MAYRKTVITFYFINRKHICDNAVISPIRLQIANSLFMGWFKFNPIFILCFQKTNTWFISLLIPDNIHLMFLKTIFSQLKYMHWIFLEIIRCRFSGQWNFLYANQIFQLQYTQLFQCHYLEFCMSFKQL